MEKKKWVGIELSQKQEQYLSRNSSLFFSLLFPLFSLFHFLVFSLRFVFFSPNFPISPFFTLPFFPFFHFPVFHLFYTISISLILFCNPVTCRPCTGRDPPAPLRRVHRQAHALVVHRVRAGRAEAARTALHVRFSPRRSVIVGHL